MTLAVQDVYVPTEGGRLFARVWTPEGAGGKTPIILVHESLGSVEVWRKFPAHLAQAVGRPVVAYDRLGFGKSDAHDGPIRRDFLFAELRVSLPPMRAALGFERFVLFGHSVGGAMALVGASDFPKDCEAVITLAGQATAEEAVRIGIRAALKNFENPEQFERVERYHGAKAQWVLDSWGGPWLSDDFLSYDLRDILGRIRCPVLVLHGEQDHFGSVLHPKILGESLGARAEVHILPNIGHSPHREDEALVLRLVSRFLEHGAQDEFSPE